MMPGSSGPSPLSRTSSTARPRSPTPSRADPRGEVVVALVSALVDDDVGLVERLRAGDESAYVELVRRYQPRMLRVAKATVDNPAVAEEACQETWLAVLRGIDR